MLKGKDSEDSDNSSVLFYAQEFCSGSVDGKDKADHTEFEAKVRQLRHHFGPFFARFSASPYPTRAV